MTSQWANLNKSRRRRRRDRHPTFAEEMNELRRECRALLRTLLDSFGVRRVRPGTRKFGGLFVRIGEQSLWLTFLYAARALFSDSKRNNR